MTDKRYELMCKRIMAQGYDMEELAEDINRHLKNGKVKADDVSAYLFRRKYMPVRVEKAFCTILNMEYKKEKIPKPCNKEGSELLSIVKGTEKGILDKLAIIHGPEYIGEIERKVNVIISAAYKYGLEVARNERLK